MRNDERYGKGKSWDISLDEDGSTIFRAHLDAYAWKDYLEVTVEHTADVTLAGVVRFLTEFVASLRRLESGEIVPEWTAVDGDVDEPDVSDIPF